MSLDIDKLDMKKLDIELEHMAIEKRVRVKYRSSPLKPPTEGTH